MKITYEVPVIPNNLKHEETIIQIANALNYVGFVFDDILATVSDRIKQKELHVSNLNDRISKVSEKIQKLAKTKKAIQVFSNSKYPATKLNVSYKSMFGFQERNIDLVSVKTKAKYNEPILHEQINNVLQFYHVKTESKKPALCTSEFDKTLEGLGGFPAGVQFINEFLLFNTDKNPYKNYEMSDPFNLSSQNVSKQSDEINKQSPDEAPLSITQHLSTHNFKENYLYSPDLGEVPSIDVPADLPDLPGIADDLRYLIELGPGIAPSVTTTPIIPDLPVIMSPSSQPSENILSNISNLENEPKVLLPELPEPFEHKEPPVEEAVLPSPPESVPLPEVTVEQTKTEIVPEPTKSAAPTATISAAVSSDVRQNLMEAIRQAGKLRKTRSEPINVKQKAPEKEANIGNDLMADLHATLALRRKGISGIRNNEGDSTVNSALSRISTLIPPPPTEGVNDLMESTATEDEENDWDE